MCEKKCHVQQLTNICCYTKWCSYAVEPGGVGGLDGGDRGTLTSVPMDKCSNV